MKMKNKLKNIISVVLATTMVLSLTPTLSFAAQVNEYVDPADNWMESNGRTGELDMNATTTYETAWCPVCEKKTTVLTYRVPEYTRSGETALNRGVLYSDGTMIDGVNKGNLDDGTPGVDAYYTGYHWTKSVCQLCGTINSVDGLTAYDFNKDVYALNSCDKNFFLDFDGTTYEHYDEDYHIISLKKGKYCQFCRGTFARATVGLDEHDFRQTVDAQLGNNRFFITEHCSDCDFETNEYVTAKSVVSAYYGVEDGEPHTLTVSDLSESGVKTSIRYGTSADECNKTSAPNYTQPGYYNVYYQINYSYAGETMTENGVSYVWILKDTEKDESNNAVVVIPTAHEHDYHYLETVKPSCENLGYDRFQCNGCGDLIKTNYTQATGHSYKAITIREATCKQGGVKLWLCSDCGDFYEETTPLASHKYKSVTHNPTCRITGHTEHICEVCGDSYITNITPIISHAYEHITKEPTCTDKGYTTHTCTMCDYHYISDYTDPSGHSWDEGHNVTSSTCTADGVIEHHCLNCNETMIVSDDATGHIPGKAATCTEPQICTVCEAVLTLPTGHNYKTSVVNPNCTAMGYTTYTCDCGDTYNGDFTDIIDHNYKTKVTEPTCTSMGYTTYTCSDCSHTYTADYTDKLAHNYTANITNPSCTEFGFTVYTCSDCGDSYTSDYTEKLEHNYNKEVIPPTCTDHGYTIYKCPDCGKEYIGDLTACEKHDFKETIVSPTCTEMGYSIFICECGETYKDNYTDKLPHNYKTEVTEPTCTTLGYTTYTCDCGDTYKSEYKEPTGHTPSDWIIDTPSSIEGDGSKHIECTSCSEVLATVVIPRLVDRDFSNEDGKTMVGAYSIIISDMNDMPIFNSETTIDVNDNVTVNLPNGRLLDFADRTKITVTMTDSKAAVANLNIFINDKNGNNATGKTDSNGILIVPNSTSSTGNDNGTIGSENENIKNTYVVTVTDKTNIIIPNCDIRIGESNNIVVDLPDGIKPTRENPVIVTVSDHNGNAQKNVTVIALGDADFIEKGITDVYGKITLPTASEGFTDNDGKVNVDNINVIVSDELSIIPNAYVVHNEDNSITVTLPDGKSISYANRITVALLDSMGNPISNTTVIVKDLAEKSYTNVTKENGIVLVPPLSEDMTDADGNGVVNGYNVNVRDASNPIENAFIFIKDGKINVVLPEGIEFSTENRITATVTDKDNKPVKDMIVIFTDKSEKSEANLTDENGIATVPPINVDYTDINGYSEVDGYIVTVENEISKIEKAFITHNVEVKNEDGTVKTAENISIELPNEVKFDYKNRITVSVNNKIDKSAVKDIEVIISEKLVDTAEAKTLKDKTDAEGKVVFPSLTEDVTDDTGNSNVTETIPGEGEDTDGDGAEDKPGADVTISYNVTVNDTKGIVDNAFIKIESGKITITLPDTHTLTTSNQITVTVTDKENKPIKDVSVTVNDKNKVTETKTTDANGKVIVPTKTSSGGGGGSSSGGGGGTSYSSTLNIKITDKDGKSVTGFSKFVDSKGNVTITLPTGKKIEGDNYYTITVTDRNGIAKADASVTLKDRNNNSANGTTDKNGVITLPAENHSAYIVGYPDGTFRPDGNMSRAEAATIFARLISEEKGENISGTKTKFTDVNKNDWFINYVSYLEKYNIIEGYDDGTFRPEEFVTRAEFVAMSVRFYGLFEEVKSVTNTTKYTDITNKHWAVKDISLATSQKWLNGYADGSFRPDAIITRAEVVAVVNRTTGRVADEDYISKNISVMNKFTDLKNNNSWNYADIMEAANDHKAVINSDGETWVK